MLGGALALGLAGLSAISSTSYIADPIYLLARSVESKPLHQRMGEDLRYIRDSWNSMTLIALMSLGITGIGLAFAWRVNSTSGFHAVMNLVLMPMLLLSGAFFPAQGASMPMQYAMKLNPLTWPSDLARTALLQGFERVTPQHWLLASVFALLAAGFGWVVLSRGRPA